MSRRAKRPQCAALHNGARCQRTANASRYCSAHDPRRACHEQQHWWWARMEYLFRALPFEIRHRWGGDAQEMVEGIDLAIASNVYPEVTRMVNLGASGVVERIPTP